MTTSNPARFRLAAPLVALSVLASLCAPAASRADDDAKPDGDAKRPFQSFMRVVDVDDHTIRLDMAVRLYAPKTGDGPTIALTGAIHIADESFYTLAQQYLDSQDLVLFEGVGMDHDRGDEKTPAGRIAKTRREMRYVAVMLERYHRLTETYPPSLAALIEKVGEYNAVKKARLKRAAVDAWKNKLAYEKTDDGYTLRSLGADGQPGGEEHDADIAFADLPQLTDDEINNYGGVQNDLAEALGLVFQLNAFDTGKANYRNSDLSIEQVQARLADGGGVQGQASIMLKALDGGSVVAQIMKLGIGLIKASPRMQVTVKLMLMEMLREAGDDITQMRGVPKSMQRLLKVIIDDRNQHVVDDLKKELAADKSSRTIAVWYGAGHMKDLEERLIDQLGYRPVGGFWLPAITMDLDEAGVTKQELEATRAMMKRMMR